MAKRRTKRDKDNGTAANLGFEQKLWAAADKMRGHMDPAEYKHVALGLIFLKHISDTFEGHRGWLLTEAANPGKCPPACLDATWAPPRAFPPLMPPRDGWPFTF